MPQYGVWTMHSASSWPEFSRALLQQTGLDVMYANPGGFHLALSEHELDVRARQLDRIQAQPGMPHQDVTIMDHAAVRRLLPDIGPEVVGGSYSKLDGHVNSLRLFRALHDGMQRFGVRYRSGQRVERIEYAAGGFRLLGGDEELRCSQVVLAAGLDNARLGPQVGLEVPVRPQRGQLVITEKVSTFLHYPTSTVRQTDEGGVMLGDSQEEAGFETKVTQDVLALIADRARRMFPRLASVNVVRTWSALRVMTPDGFPIYDQSVSCPGAFAASCHSGVTLAAVHALVLAPSIAAGHLAPGILQAMSARRFDVQKAA